MWSFHLLLTLMCVIIVTESARLKSVKKRQADFSCSVDQTQITSPWLYVDGTDCGTLIGEITDFYDNSYRQECQRWQGLASKPHRIGDAYVDECYQFTNGTVRYRSRICCEGQVTSQRCMACLNGTISYDSQSGYHVEGCNHYGNVETCPNGQICRTTFTHYNEATTPGQCKVRRYLNKMCAPAEECNDLQANNSLTCKSYTDPATCTYCCNGSFCNYKTDIAQPYPCPKAEPKTGCDATPCYSGGTCVANETLSAGYYCICPPYRYGNRCQYHYCRLSPCMNRGYCRTSTQTPYYQCHCRIGWTGENCTTEYSKCSSDYCLNNGTCYDHETYGLRCLCPEGFAGAKCEIQTSFCRVPSLSYTYPSEFVGKYNRNCTSLQEHFSAQKDGYLNYCNIKFRWNKFGTVKSLQSLSLPACERGDTYNWFRQEYCCPACFSNPCQNGGWCVEHGNQDYICKCRYGYEGKNCENKVAVCFASGDPHYKTFDGQMMHFQGRCKYTLASKCIGNNTDLVDFQVNVQNEHRDGDNTFTYTKYVEVQIYDHVILMDRDNQVFVDGNLVKPQVFFPGFKIIYNGKYVRLETNMSLSVENDGQWTSFVKIGPQYAGALCGICGNYDGNAINDYTQEDGTDVSTLDNKDYLTADSWFVSDSNNPGCNRTAAEIPECNDTMKAEIAKEDYCGLIASSTSPFDVCLSRGIVSRDDFYFNCEYDTCAFMLNATLAKIASCRNLAVLADTCEQSGILIDWRTVANCPLGCGDGLVYTRQGSACPATCENPDAEETCSLPDTETCICPPGFLLKDDECVEPSECGCTHEGNTYQIGETWDSPTCESFNCTVCDDCVYPVGKVVQMNSDGCKEEACKYEFQPSDCNQCKAISNEAGYLEHPCNCSHYIQCQKVNEAWQGHIMDCPPCTCWNQETLACERVDGDCKDSSTGGNDNVTSHQDTCSKGSNTFKIHAEVTKYTWKTATGDYVMACPCGTVFSLTECGCVQSDGYDCNLPSEVTCLSFDAGWDGFEASNWVWVSSGGVQIEPNGVKGNCGRFDGASKLEIPYFTNAYSAYGEITISFWYKREGGANGEQGLISNTDCSNQKSVEIRAEEAGLLGGGIQTSNDNVFDEFSDLQSDDDKWHHVVLTYNGEKVDFYLDNVKQSPDDLEVTGSLANSQCPLVVGSMYGDKYFKGLIDEICIYDAGFTAEEVAVLFNA